MKDAVKLLASEFWMLFNEFMKETDGDVSLSIKLSKAAIESLFNYANNNTMKFWL